MQRRTLLTALAAAPLSSFAAETKLRVAVIGHTGRGNYGHGLDTMWKAIPATEIVAIADADAKGLEGELKKIGTGKGYADYHAMLAEVKPDIVAIGPRHIDQHRDMMLAAIQNGAKGIYIEKPFVRSLAEADEVIAAAEKSGTKIAIAHRNRYHPALPMVAKLIADGAIGRVLEIRGRGKEDPRGGSLDMWVLGSHVMGTAIALAGPARACTASVYQSGHLITKADVKDGDEGIGPLAGDEVHARFEMENGLPFFFDSIKDARLKKPAYDDPASFGLQIFGNAGVIDLRMDQEPFAWIQTGNEARKPVLADKDIAKKVSSHEIPGLDLLAAIRENRAPLCDAVHARHITEMISAVFESHRLNSQRVPMPLKTRVNPLTLL